MNPGTGFQAEGLQGRRPRGREVHWRGPGQGGGLPARPASGPLEQAHRPEHPVWPGVPIRQENLAVWVLTQKLDLFLNSHNQLYFS